MHARQVFEVLCQPAAASEPTERALDNPALGQDLEALGRVGALDDFEWGLCIGLNLGRCRSALIAAIGDGFLDARKHLACDAQQRRDALRQWRSCASCFGSTDDRR